MAEELTRQSRAGDLVARYGGEQFAIILPDTQPMVALAVADGFRVAIAALERPVSVTASLGVASHTGRLTDPLGLVQAADEALYVAKHGGRNRTVAAPGHEAPAAERPSLRSRGAQASGAVAAARAAAAAAAARRRLEGGDLA